jgi:hypothetical protein
MNVLPDLLPNRWLLVVAPHAANELMMDLLARLAHRGPVRIVDGGDRFRAHSIARSLRRATRQERPDLYGALQRIHLARAFTCYQMVTLLEELITPTETAPPEPLPTLALDLLTTFYDESIPLVESQRLLEICLGCLSKLSSQGPLAVSVRPPRVVDDRLVLVDQLIDRAGQVIHLEAYAPPAPLRLF